MNPRYGDIDPYWMAASAIDEAVRNCVAVGADPKRIAILDNFCWGNTDRPETLGSLVRAALGCYDTAIAYGTPFVSGKDSLNNEFTYVDGTGTKRTISIPPSLLITALGQIDDVEQAVTMDLKEPGDVLYLVGDTQEELGGSHYAMIHGIDGGRIPHVDLIRAPGLYAQVHAAIRSGSVKSCHDLSEGGLAVALAEACFAGGLGADIDLSALAARSAINDPSVLLFSESNTRFLIEVVAANVASFEVMMSLPDRDSRAVRLGVVNNSGKLLIRRTADAECVVDATIEELKASWQQPLARG
jgi:phosphoribosylformylglycinamidine synthase